MCIRDRYQRRVHGEEYCNMRTFILCAIFAALTLATDPPVWPNQWQATFTETSTYPLIGTHTNKGAFYYNYDGLAYRIDRDNGQFDRYCGTVYKFQNTPCNQIVSSGKRYLVFPEKQDCCYCCADEHGCGVLKPNWLSQAQYQGTVEEGGSSYEKWVINGLQANYYYATNDAKRVPYKIDQQPNDVVVYDVNSFQAAISDPAVFDLPEYCDPNRTCDFLSVCTLVRYAPQSQHKMMSKHTLNVMTNMMHTIDQLTQLYYLLFNKESQNKDFVMFPKSPSS
eukprot:TRINITY_DN2176_c0_g1_i3.p1 TRINITY_DN2176_c0_g1~~TRINITY_DN2176_c0_g1_i3.p1  ORF type:complete len:280 (+),score=58.19 TRINITY_DN2176_c0_g1_i3:66-905(+)